MFLEILEENATKKFQGTPSIAAAHFAEKITDRRLVRVFGSVSKTWWRNSLAAPYVFLDFLEEDATKEFHGEPSVATAHLTQQITMT